MTEQRRTSGFVGKWIPWLIGTCILSFLGLVAAGAYEALTDSSVLAKNTPVPVFVGGTVVKLAERDGQSVTVWQVDSDCEVGPAYGQVLPGSEARILEDSCYNSRRRTHYYRIALLNGSTGWVEEGGIVLATEYAPPTPIETPQSTSTPWPSPTPQPIQTPTPLPLSMGSPLSVGTWGVRVDRVEIADSLSSPSADKTVTAVGRFALVFLTVSNRSSRAKTLHASSVYIEDAEGNRYPNDDLASIYASSADCADYALDVEPDETVCMVAAIDISTQSSYYLFSLHGADDWVLLDMP